MAAPIARKTAHSVYFGKVENEERGATVMSKQIVREDPYFWLRDDKRENEEVLNYLRAENAWTESQLGHLEPSRKKIYDEFLSHIQETDEKVAYRRKRHFYYTKTIKGQSYRIHCRKEQNSQEQVVLDINLLAKDKKYCQVGVLEPSPDRDEIVAYSVDFTGDEVYDIRILDVTTNEIKETLTGKLGGDVEWGADATEIYYVSLDDALKPYKVWRHKIGTDQSKDECILTETDTTYILGIEKSCSERFLFTHTATSSEDEYRYIDLLDPKLTLTLVQERQKELRYNVEHHADLFYLTTNKDGCTESKFVSVPIATPGASNWTDVWPYAKEVSLSSVMPFKNFVVLTGRRAGLRRIWVWNPTTKDKYEMEFPETVYHATLGANYVYDTDVVRVVYSSMTSPESTYDINMKTQIRELKRQEPVPNYDSSKYSTTQMLAKSHDGTSIPMLIAYRNDIYPEGIEQGGPHPVFLYGYGSYGLCMEPRFDSTKLPLLDRGVILAVALIRGGGEMGRWWYEKEGKYLNKKNTFLDFIACAEHLVAANVTTPQKIGIEGRSAGGLLVGAVLNLRPDLFKVAIAGVPFVDLMVTMCDSSIPLTTEEWLEWGNPNDDKYFYYMLEYSPLDNIRMQRYPSILVTAGLHDPRVAYWEPAKWVAKLRHMKIGDSPLFFKCDLSSGHFSASDRYKYLKELSFDYSFLLEQLECEKLL